MGERKTDLAKCLYNNENHKDCCFRLDGFCEALSKCIFADGRCHFYKTDIKKANLYDNRK